MDRLTLVNDFAAVAHVVANVGPLRWMAIAEMAKVEGAVVGAGTVLNETQLDQAIEAGSKFIVSPGLTDVWAARRLNAACLSSPV